MGCKSSKNYEIEENTLSSETKELLQKYEKIQELKQRRHSDPVILIKPIFKRKRRERHPSV